MVAQARAELPNECCGLLAGLVDEGNIGRVHQHYPLVNNAASPREYLANDRTLFHAHRDMRERGLQLLAIYHSHPVSDPVPSKTDLERNFFDDVMHLIVSLKTEVPLLRGWWLTEKEYREAEWEVQP
ncbi:MAG TPA: M67 family metallopeptidase [Gemmataceae bacterium]|nr:M67 family metallopeptidase [Gemmataceae bacterium]